MAFGKQIGLKGLTYRGGGPMLAFLLHRISGLGIILFVGLHVVAGFLSHVVATDQASEIGNTLNIIYESWAFQIFIYFCVLYHALHGLRVTLLDLWPGFLKFQREAIWLQWLIFIPVYALTIFIMVRNALAGG